MQSLGLFPGADEAPLAPQVRGYRVERLLSEQGQGEVYLAICEEDGSTVAFPAISPAGWQITLGDESAFIDETGDFAIEVVEGGATEGRIVHPSEEEDVAVFSVDQLAAEGETPTTIVISMEFQGGCCMTPEDGCCPTDSAESSASLIIDPKSASTSKTNPTFNWGFCLLTDGPLSDVDSLLGYFGSTCSARVDAGCCPNEGGSFLGGGAIALGVVKRTSCIDNHKGRYCQELLPGDLVVTPPGTLPGVVEVKLGEKLYLLVHNNGCFGKTYISKLLGSDLGGIFKGTGYDGRVLKHYTGQKGNWTYFTDRAPYFKAPNCTDNLQAIDTYTFRAEGTSGFITFKIKMTNIWRFKTGSKQYFSGSTFTVSPSEPPSEENDFKGCADNHMHGRHPCTGAEDPDPKGCGHGQVTQVAP